MAEFDDDDGKTVGHFRIVIKRLDDNLMTAISNCLELFEGGFDDIHSLIILMAKSTQRA